MKTERRAAETQRGMSLVIPNGLQSVRNLLLHVLAVFGAALREIFDESAYARFLQRNRLTSSGAAYAAFVRERSGSRPKPRCC